MVELRISAWLRRVKRARPVALLVLWSLLWSQFAIASYACPMMSPAGRYAATALGDTLKTGDHPMPGATAGAPVHDCDGMLSTSPVSDPDNPSLCFQHCVQGSQHVDHAQPMPVVMALGPVIAIVADQPTASAIQRDALERKLSHSSSPPKSIAHCCFRI